MAARQDCGSQEWFEGFFRLERSGARAPRSKRVRLPKFCLAMMTRQNRMQEVALARAMMDLDCWNQQSSFLGPSMHAGSCSTTLCPFGADPGGAPGLGKIQRHSVTRCARPNDFATGTREGGEASRCTCWMNWKSAEA